jgi:ferredoxin
MTLVPIIDAGACLAHGDCAALAPDVFEVRGDLAVVVGDGPEAVLRAAARSCPAGAILLVDPHTGEEVE